MEIDWFTVGAQLVNFVVLFWLLSRFLYRPIVDAVDRREATITERLEAAERREEEAETTRRHYEQLEAELEEAREERLAEARREADEKRRELLEEIRQEVEQTREQWFERLQAEQARFLDEFTRRLEEQIFGMAEDALEDLADVEVAAKIVDRFVDRLDEDAGEIDTAVRGLEPGGAPVRVRSSFPLEEEQRERIRRRLTDQGDREIDVDFVTDDDLVAGIEVRVGARRFGWNIRAYLDALRTEFDEMLGAAEMSEEVAADG